MEALYPQLPLSHFVEVIWLMPERQGVDRLEMALPTGTVELVINLDHERTRTFAGCDPDTSTMLCGPVVCGPYSTPFLIDAAEPGRTLGVHFKPGGATRLLPVPVRELENLQVEFEAITPALSRELQELVGAAKGDDRRLLQTVEAWLTGLIRCRRRDVVVSSVNRLLRESRPDVGTLVDDSGLSHRRFNELFREEVGVSAKRFSRIARFQQALRYIEHHDGFDWVEVALDCRFYDQAHLIHEFRRHGNMTPAQYLKKRTDRLNHPVLN